MLNQGYGKLASLEKSLNRKDLTRRLKVQLIRTIVFPVVAYGCESWTLKKDQVQKLKAFEMKCYRRVLKIRHGERIPNATVLSKCKTTTMLIRHVRARKAKYYGHTARHDSLEQTIMFGMVPGTRRQGGQRKQWIQDIINWLDSPEGEENTVSGTYRLAQDRPAFQRACENMESE